MIWQRISKKFWGNEKKTRIKENKRRQGTPLWDIEQFPCTRNGASKNAKLRKITLKTHKIMQKDVPGVIKMPNTMFFPNFINLLILIQRYLLLEFKYDKKWSKGEFDVSKSKKNFVAEIKNCQKKCKKNVYQLFAEWSPTLSGCRLADGTCFNCFLFETEQQGLPGSCPPGLYRHTGWVTTSREGKFFLSLTTSREGNHFSRGGGQLLRTIQMSPVFYHDSHQRLQDIS